MGRAPARAAESPKLRWPGAAPGRPALNSDCRMQSTKYGGRFAVFPCILHFAFCILHLTGVVADKQCTCPASKLMWERYPPTPPFHCGKLDQSTEMSLINSF